MNPTNYWKLGLFVVVAVGLAIGAIGWIGAAHFERETRDAVTYLDESVQGLDVGSPVKIRGVTVGRVSSIGFAPDHMRVEIAMKIFVDAMHDLGFVEFGGPEGEGDFVPSNVRIRLATAGITGLKFLEVDFTDESDSPVPDLGFEAPWAYVPPAPSRLKSLEDAGMELLEVLPAVVLSADSLIQRAETKLEEIDLESLQRRVEALLTQTEAVVAEVDQELEAADIAATLVKVDTLLAEGQVTMRSVQTLLEEWGDAEKGPLASSLAELTQLSEDIRGAIHDAEVSSTVETLRSAGGSIALTSEEFGLVGEELTGTLEALQQTLAVIRSLAAKLERDPGILLRGSGGERP